MLRQRGFTLIELMIVVAIIAIIAAIAIPNLLAARIQANESAAIATLKAIANAQSQCEASRQIDVNNNGKGEYGFLAEMGARVGIRTASGNPGSAAIRPPLMTVPAGGPVVLQGGAGTTGGAMMRSGYYFMMFLPSSTANFIPESDNGGATPLRNPDPSMSESLWCAYAWPVSIGNSGNRAFFVNQSGEILVSQNRGATAMTGPARGPDPFAAFLASVSPPVLMTSSVAANGTGKDSQRWTVVN